MLFLLLLRESTCVYCRKKEEAFTISPQNRFPHRSLSCPFRATVFIYLFFTETIYLSWAQILLLLRFDMIKAATLVLLMGNLRISFRIFSSQTPVKWSEGDRRVTFWELSKCHYYLPEGVLKEEVACILTVPSNLILPNLQRLQDGNV